MKEFQLLEEHKYLLKEMDKIDNQIQANLIMCQQIKAELEDILKKDKKIEK